VKYAGVDDNGVVTVDIDIPKFDTFRENVADEVKEHLEKLPNVKEVHVNL